MVEKLQAHMNTWFGCLLPVEGTNVSTLMVTSPVAEKAAAATIVFDAGDV